MTSWALIDAALGYYCCLNDEKKREYEAHLQELLDRRPTEIDAISASPDFLSALVTLSPFK